MSSTTLRAIATAGALAVGVAAFLWLRRTDGEGRGGVDASRTPSPASRPDRDGSGASAVASAPFDDGRSWRDVIRRMAFGDQPSRALDEALALAAPNALEAGRGARALFEALTADLADGAAPTFRNPIECARFLAAVRADGEGAVPARDAYFARDCGADAEHLRFRALTEGWPEAPRIEVDRLAAELARAQDRDLAQALTGMLGTETGRRAALLHLEGLLRRTDRAARPAIVVCGLLGDARVVPSALVADLVSMGGRFQREAGTARSPGFDLALIVAGALDGEAAEGAAAVNEGRRTALGEALSALNLDHVDDASAVPLTMMMSASGAGDFGDRLALLSADVRRSAMARESALVSLGLKLPADRLLRAGGVDLERTPATPDDVRLAVGALSAIQNSVSRFPDSAAAAQSAYRKALESWTDVPAAREARLALIRTIVRSGAKDLAPSLEFVARNAADAVVAKAAADAAEKLAR